MKGSKLFKDGIFKKIAADIPQEETVGCEEVDLNGQLVVPPYVDPHLHLDYVFTASLGEENGSGTLFEGIQRWSESKGNVTVAQMKERIYSGIRKEMLHGVQAIRTHIDVTDPTFTGLKAALEVRDEVKDILDLQIVAFPQEGMYAYKDWLESSVKNQSTRQSNWLSNTISLSMYIVMRQTIRRAAFWSC